MNSFEFVKDVNTLYYMSSKCRSYIPAKSLIVMAPDNIASSIDRLKDFAVSSGWVDAAENDGAVLMLPVCENGWVNEETSRIKRIYKTVWKDTLSPDPHEIFKTVWCWETLIFAIGYDEGAVFAGNAAVNEPNAFADVALINGVPSDFSGGEKLSDRWLLPDASGSWLRKNKDVPVAVWFLGNENTEDAEKYFSTSGESYTTKGTFGADPDTTTLILAEFQRHIRWKNSPDGTLASLKPKTSIETDGEYVVDTVENNGNTYTYYTRIPIGADTTGMPVVISMHGHGEPAWMFAQKNGWPELQDETRDFILVCPDSPENSWLIERDEDMHKKMLDKLSEKYHIDRSRVYLTGFSNGSMATCWYAERHPELYAACSPWNSPLLAYENLLLENGWEMPMFAINGDLDHKMDIPRRGYSKLFEAFIRINGGTPIKTLGSDRWQWKYDEKWDLSNTYTPENGYKEGDRLTTWVYLGRGSVPRFCFTEIRDMPHGAIHDEARAAWFFLKHFSRPVGNKSVKYTK
jgi:poly(3-hydroxybutyrate) depolymerase